MLLFKMFSDFSLKDDKLIISNSSKYKVSELNSSSKYDLLFVK